MTAGSRIEVVPYDPTWPTIFEEIRTRLWPALADLASSIEHVGSTSVVGLAAKPVIDISIVVPSEQQLAPAIARLAALGYRHLGNLGIAGREAFERPIESPRHNLYLCPAGSLGLTNHLAVRDYLRHHPAAVAAYAQLKLELAQRFPYDIDRYVDGKTDFILSILQAQQLGSDQLTSIEQANRLNDIPHSNA